jgi:SAM-dependent MidA family methyltransferase
VLTPQALPPLSGEEAGHSARVALHLRGLVAGAGGWLPFAQFMEAALYAPGLGYYVAGREPFGAAGDFVTAPELSPLFANCLAAQVAEILHAAGGGDVVEYGAGSGRLALDLLTALERRGALPDRYRIVEVSAALRERQRALLAAVPPLAARVDWLEQPPPAGWRGVAIANEVLDALPVERFRIGRAGHEALGVVAAEEGFAWRARPAGPQLGAAIDRLQQRLPAPLPPGYVSELCPGLPSWIAAAARGLARGALLIVDYGLPRAQYYHASRDGGTLCAFHRHRRVDDVFQRPGLLDLTAWVDFSAAADAARDAGLAVAGLATQAHFLLALGVERELAALLEGAEPARRHALAQAAQTLMLPGEMGERFKVMALARGVAGPLAGFAFRDLAASL